MCMCCGVCVLCVYTCVWLSVLAVHACVRYIRAALDGPHVLWIDNFSKFFARSVPTMEKSVFSTCLWTGVSLFGCTDTKLSDTVVVDSNDCVVPAMPPDILMYQPSVSIALQYFLDKGYRQYDGSLVVQYDVRNIPLKIDTKRFPNMQPIVDSYSFDNVRPVDLLDINIGSNRGLIAVLRGLYEDKKMGSEMDCQRYTTLNVDENIFWRVLKVRFAKMS